MTETMERQATIKTDLAHTRRRAELDPTSELTSVGLSLGEVFHELVTMAKPAFAKLKERMKNSLPSP